MEWYSEHVRTCTAVTVEILNQKAFTFVQQHFLFVLSVTTKQKQNVVLYLMSTKEKNSDWMSTFLLKCCFINNQAKASECLCSVSLPVILNQRPGERQSTPDPVSPLGPHQSLMDSYNNHRWRHRAVTLCLPVCVLTRIQYSTPT